MQYRKNGLDLKRPLNQPIYEDSQEQIEDGEQNKPIQYEDDDD